MSGITLNTVFNNPLLSSANSLGENILSFESTLGWFQADSNHVSMSGDEIVSFKHRSNNNASFLEVNSQSRSKLVNSELQQYSAAQFIDDSINGGSADVYKLVGLDFDTNQPYSIVTVFKPTNPSDGDTIFSKFTSGSSRSVLSITNNGLEVRFYHGTSNYLSHPVEPHKWCFLIASFDGRDIRLFADNIEYSPSPATGTGGSGNVNIGALGDSGSQGFNGFISDLILFNKDIISSGDEIEIVKDYMNLVYGL